MKSYLVRLVSILLLVSTSSFAQEVKLLQATSSVGFSFANFFAGDILVENQAYDKKVTVVVSINDNEWQEYSAYYVESLDNGLELWHFEEMSPYVDSEYQFAIKYQVNGETFWDNNQGTDYYLSKVEGGRVEKNFILDADSMLKAQVIDDWRRSTEGTYFFRGTIYLQNLAYQKEVDVIYSRDNWQTVEQVAAQYLDSNNQGTAEEWQYVIESDEANQHVEFAIRYRVNGEEYWDNNFGRNYSR